MTNIAAAVLSAFLATNSANDGSVSQTAFEIHNNAHRLYNGQSVTMSFMDAVAPMMLAHRAIRAEGYIEQAKQEVEEDIQAGREPVLHSYAGDPGIKIGDASSDYSIKSNGTYYTSKPLQNALKMINIAVDEVADNCSYRLHAHLDEGSSDFAKAFEACMIAQMPTSGVSVPIVNYQNNFDFTIKPL